MKPGTQVAGRYQIEKEVGSGHHGRVYRAWDPRLQARIAIKISDGTDVSCFNTFKARFKREAMIGYHLGRYEGFVSALDWGEVDPVTFYLAMDLVSGARPLDLRHRDRALRLSQLLDAARLVDRAHKCSVIHRDLKPTNFLVDENHQVFMADFGLAKIVGEEDEDQKHLLTLTQTNTALGTCVYMSPEQFENAKDADFQSDVYSLGVMLYRALTDRFPYEGKSGPLVFKKLMLVRHGRAPAARPRNQDKTISSGLDDLCARSIAVDRGDRIRTVDEFVSGLERVARRGGGRTSRRVQRPSMMSTPPSSKPEPSPSRRVEHPSFMSKGVTEHGSPWKRFGEKKRD